ncbi:hypothetical protein [Archangium lansingense]|uniref:Uncharacterized protein n=1 Tax=Archangium lansingense TaxID=2995310 RepID=A0ABT4AA88_9BACT|nr:hypothetical protein [Archangium lansinium]MCY1077857.1 hypothetical protein [Archangium lansinium]
MPAIVATFVPVVIALLLWLLGQGSRAVARGGLFALIVTSVMALPPLALCISVGFTSLGMMFIIIWLFAVASAGAGLIAFVVGFVAARRSEEGMSGGTQG